MNKTLKNVLIFAVGATIGTVATVLVMKKRCDIIIEEEVESMRDSLRDALKKKQEKIIEDAEAMNDELSASIQTREKKESRDGQRRKERYTKIVNKMGYRNIDEDEEEDYRKYEKITEDSNNAYAYDNKPHVITTEQFVEEMDHYDKITVYYYEDDETLADENEEIISDADYIIGTDSLDRFGDGSGDPEVVYVRNDKLQIDYEVIRLSKSYAETVLGVEGRDNL